jgi:hypothetical protein
MVYIGVDLHRKRSQLAALDEAGELLFNRSIASQSDAFLRVFGELAPEPIEVAFEATIGWGWFADLLADAGVEAHMAHPLATRAIATARVKNDAVDALTCCAPICCPRPGSRRSRSVRRDAWCACGPAWSGFGPG